VCNIAAQLYMTSKITPKENVVFLTGDDRARILQRRRWWEEAFSKKHGAMNVEQYDAKEVTAEDAKTAAFTTDLLTPSLFAEKRLLILRSFPASSEGTSKSTTEQKEAQTKREERIVEALLQLPPELVVVVVSLKPDKRRTLYKTMHKQFRTEEYWMQEVDVHAQVTMELAGLLAPADVPYVVQVLSSRRESLAQDMQMLRQYAAEEQLTREVVDALCPMALEEDVFETLRLVFSGEKKTSIQRIERALMRGAEPLKLLGAFVWQLEQCMLVRTVLDAKLGQKVVESTLGMKPYAFQKTSALERHLRREDLGYMIHALATLDRKAKSGVLDATKGSNDFAQALSVWITRAPAGASS